METLIIAEIAQAHEGSLGILHSYIDALANTGVNAVKFQTHIADAESSIHEPFRVKFSYVDQTRYDYWKRMEFTATQWEGIKQHCEEKGLEFISSPFSIKAVELLEELKVKRYKIASGEISNFLLLERIAKTKKPVILSSGMSDFNELQEAVKFFQLRGIDTSVLQCTTMYPTPPEKLGLNVIPVLKERFKCRVGFSDHSGDITACLAARALGADILEFHAVFDRRMFGPDATSSLTIDEIRSLVSKVRYLEKALGHPVDKDDTNNFLENKKIFGKSLAVSADLPKGHALRFEDLESKKPAGHGIPASQYESVIGKKLNKDLMKYSFLTADDLQKE
jgi:N,N'-diacetyllegionaminate synthase